MMWQKARVILPDDHPWLGRELWVEGRPVLHTSISETDRSIRTILSFQTHILISPEKKLPPVRSNRYGIDKTEIELLPEFADHMKLVPEKEWLSRNVQT